MRALACVPDFSMFADLENFLLFRVSSWDFFIRYNARQGPLLSPSQDLVQKLASNFHSSTYNGVALTGDR